MEAEGVAAARTKISKKKKFVADGVMKAELNSFLSRTLAQEGYSGINVQSQAVSTEITISASRVREVLGTNGVRLRELTSMIQKRFNYPPDTLELFVKRIESRGLSAAIQAESLKYKLLNQFPVRMAANGVVFFAMRNGAKGVEVIVSGKLRAQRAKSMKFKDGYMVHSGNPKLDFIDTAYRHVHLKQGVLGVQVKIMLPHDPTGIAGVKTKMPDYFEVFPPRTRG